MCAANFIQGNKEEDIAKIPQDTLELSHNEIMLCVAYGNEQVLM